MSEYVFHVPTWRRWLLFTTNSLLSFIPLVLVALWLIVKVRSDFVFYIMFLLLVVNTFLRYYSINPWLPSPVAEIQNSKSSTFCKIVYLVSFLGYSTALVLLFINIRDIDIHPLNYIPYLGLSLSIIISAICDRIYIYLSGWTMYVIGLGAFRLPPAEIIVKVPDAPVANGGAHAS